MSASFQKCWAGNLQRGHKPQICQLLWQGMIAGNQQRRSWRPSSHRKGLKKDLQHQWGQTNYTSLCLIMWSWRCCSLCCHRKLSNPRVTLWHLYNYQSIIHWFTLRPAGLDGEDSLSSPCPGLTWKLSLGCSAGLVYTGLFAAQNPLRTPRRWWWKWSWAFVRLWAVRPAPESTRRPLQLRHGTVLPSSLRSTSSTWTPMKYRSPPGRPTAGQK